MKTRYLLLLPLMLLVKLTQAQVGIPNTTSTDPSAELKVESTSSPKKGVLFPLLTTPQVLAIASPATGLLVFDVTDNVLKHYSGSTWLRVNETPQYTSATLPVAPQLFTGEVIYCTTSNELLFYNGSSWQRLVKKGASNKLPNN